MKIVKPSTTLFALLSVAALCGIAMVFFPENGIAVGSMKIRFKTWSSLFDTVPENRIEDIEKFLAQYDSIGADSTVVDSVQNLVIVRKQGVATIQFQNEDSSPLFSFFEALHRSRDLGENVHIIHYGDSQIETDRITGYLRQQWQNDFGGDGPGLVSPVPLTPSSALNQERSANWKRYTAYGFDDGKSIHNRYGILASFGRFTPTLKPGSPVQADSAIGWIEFAPSGMAQPKCKNFDQISVLFGYHQAGVVLELFVNDSLVDREKYEPTAALLEYKYDLKRTPKKIRIRFKGQDSPDVHAVCLQSKGGVNVDNVAMRGCDGNIFKRIASSDIQRALVSVPTELIIMQYGGNAMPYIDSKEEADNYGKFFQSQIRYMKENAPKASILVIGPSDMSTSINGVYQTWPHLEEVRDALKAAAFAEGCGFWDMYEVMGGKNSMLSWVSNNPPYAGPDYTHFTPLGAKRVSELLYKALKQEYDAWLVAKANSSNS